MQAIPTFASLPQFIETITLGGERFRLRFTWRERTAAWYLDVETQDGTKLASGRRLVAKGAPLGGLLIEGGPQGLFLVDAVNITAREQLGVDAFLLFLPTDEYPEETVPEAGFRVVIG